MQGYGLILAAAVCWGVMGPLAKGVYLEGVSAMEVAFWRALLAGAVFVAHSGARGQLIIRSRRDAGLLAGFALFGVTLFYASYNLAIQKGGVSLAAILLYTAPAFVVIAAALILHEPLTRRKVVLTLLTLLGVVLVCRSGDGNGQAIRGEAVLWGLLAGLSYASYYIFGKWVLRRYEPATIYAAILPLGALGLVPWVRFHALTPRAVVLLGAIAIVSTYGAYLLYYSGLKRVEASRAVLVATVEPVIATVLGALIYGERLGGWSLIGAGAILGSAVLATMSDRPGAAQPNRPTA